MIRPCRDDERPAILAIVNAAAEAYRGVIPADRWREPYMPAEELDAEIRGVGGALLARLLAGRDEARPPPGPTSSPAAVNVRLRCRALRARRGGAHRR